MNTANLTISCPDKVGIVNEVTLFLTQHNANISYLEQHIEGDHFFMRVEWEVLNSTLSDSESFNRHFQNIKDKLNISSKVDFNNKKKRLGLFCSKEPHCLIDILSRAEIGELNIEIPFVISNFRDNKFIAEKFDIPFFHVPSKGDYEKEQIEIIKNHKVDLIGLARYMKILSAEFVDEIGQDRIINVHHSFLPSFVGAKPYEEAYERGVKLIGATSHYVIPELDQGPIIEQNVKRVSHNYDISDFKLMGRELEKEVFAFAIKKHLENKLIAFENRVIVFS